jgi:hypothetical protein
MNCSRTFLGPTDRYWPSMDRCVHIVSQLDTLQKKGTTTQSRFLLARVRHVSHGDETAPLSLNSRLHYAEYVETKVLLHEASWERTTRSQTFGHRLFCSYSCNTPPPSSVIGVEFPCNHVN